MKIVEMWLNFYGEPINVGNIASIGDKHAITLTKQESRLRMPGMEQLKLTPIIPYWLSDAMPDAWGQRVMLHELKKAGVDIKNLTLADKLSYLGQNCLGAWEFIPDSGLPKTHESLKGITWMRDQAALLLNDKPCDTTWMSGSMDLGGARPKMFVDIVDDQINLSAAPREREWILKLPGAKDADDIGCMEYAYARMARDFGILMAEPKLINDQYFATRRFDFDCETKERYLLRSLAGLNKVPHQNALSNGYETIFDRSIDLMGSHGDVDQVARIAIFNQMMLNMDDHAKNISFLMDGQGGWRLAPAYDITYNIALGGRAMSVNGETQPTLKDFEESFSIYGIRAAGLRGMIDQLAGIVSQWHQYMEEACVHDGGIAMLSDIKDEIKNFSGISNVVSLRSC